LQLEVSEDEQNDPGSQTDHYFLPDGGAILVREIKNALGGESFKVFPPGGIFQKDVQGMAAQDVTDYLTIFNRFKMFGLPHGRGWVHELPWVVDLLEFLSVIYEQIKAWRYDQGTRTPEATPEEIGLEG